MNQEKEPELDKFTGRPANSHTLSIKFTDLSSEDARALLAAFVRTVEDGGSQEHRTDTDGPSGQYHLVVSDGSTIREKVVAALTTQQSVP